MRRIHFRTNVDSRSTEFFHICQHTPWTTHKAYRTVLVSPTFYREHSHHAISLIPKQLYPMLMNSYNSTHSLLIAIRQFGIRSSQFSLESRLPVQKSTFLILSFWRSPLLAENQRDNKNNKRENTKQNHNQSYSIDLVEHITNQLDQSERPSIAVKEICRSIFSGWEQKRKNFN